MSDATAEILVTPRSVAIIGAGAAGFYVADALSRKRGDVRIELFERLAFPFGLVRYGVAADHQGTKSVTRVLSRVMKGETVRYHGGIELGRDVSLQDLCDSFDAVVLATGVSHGRCLPVQGLADRKLAAFDLIKWLNGHPDSTDWVPPSPDLRSVAVMGLGNVSLDVVRILAKDPDEINSLDLADAAKDWLRRLTLDEIHVLGRGGAGETRFDAAVLRELETLSGFQPMVDAADLEKPEAANPAVQSILETWSQLPQSGRRPIRFHFHARVQSGKDGRVEVLSGVSVEPAAEADLLIQAIGQVSAEIAGVPFDDATGALLHQEGRLSGFPNVFVAGWAASPNAGNLAEARRAAGTVAAALLDQIDQFPRRDSAALLGRLESIASRVDWADWSKLDEIEKLAGEEHGAPRRKLILLSEIRKALEG